MTRPAVLVTAALSASRRSAALTPLLGEAGWERLEEVLLRRAAAWALAAAPDSAFVALADEASGSEAALPDGVRSFTRTGGTAPERLAAEVDHVLAVTGAPVIVVRPDFPRLDGYHARAAVDDLRDGCDVVLGVAIGGGLYLLGVREPQPRLFALAGTAEDGETTRRNAREVTEGLELEVGMLHYERALVGAGDVAALLADPLAPGDVRAVLGAAGARGWD